MNDAAQTITHEIADTFGTETLVHMSQLIKRFAGHRKPTEIRDALLVAQSRGLVAINRQTVSVNPR